jgi:hypothetical protein
MRTPSRKTIQPAPPTILRKGHRHTQGRARPGAYDLEIEAELDEMAEDPQEWGQADGYPDGDPAMIGDPRYE